LTVDPWPLTLDPWPLTVHRGPWVVGCGLWVVGCGRSSSPPAERPCRLSLQVAMAHRPWAMGHGPGAIAASPSSCYPGLTLNCRAGLRLAHNDPCRRESGVRMKRGERRAESREPRAERREQRAESREERGASCNRRDQHQHQHQHQHQTQPQPQTSAPLSQSLPRLPPPTMPPKYLPLTLA
jgi:hypothetical protein